MQTTIFKITRRYIYTTGSPIAIEALRQTHPRPSAQSSPFTRPAIANTELIPSSNRNTHRALFISTLSRRNSQSNPGLLASRHQLIPPDPELFHVKAPSNFHSLYCTAISSFLDKASTTVASTYIEMSAETARDTPANRDLPELQANHLERAGTRGGLLPRTGLFHCSL
jgi:hypothetical protein